MPSKLAKPGSKRNSNLEILRIISMLLIIAYHATRNGYTNVDQPLIVYSSGVILGSWGLLGVDLFVIISAWFLSSQKFRITKAVHIAFQTFTWVLGNVFIYVLYSRFFYLKSLSSIARHIINDYIVEGFFQPFWSKLYWFVTAYFFMLILSPVINKLLCSFDKEKLKMILTAFIFIPVLSQFATSPICDIFCFLYIYLLVGYIRLYGSKTIEKYSKGIYCLLIICIVIISKFAIFILPRNSFITQIVTTILNNTFAATDRHSIIILILSLLLFFTVVKKEERHNALINSIASYTFGVYFFHENFIAQTPNTPERIFGKLTELGFISANLWFPLKYLGIVCAVFIVGTALEWIRTVIIQKPFMKLITSKFSAKFDAVDNYINSL